MGFLGNSGLFVLETAFSLCLLDQPKTSVRSVELVVLSYYCEGELVVSLGDECYCVAVPRLKRELVSGVCTAGARRVDGKEDAGAIDDACWESCGNCPCGPCVLVAVLVLDVVAG